MRTVYVKSSLERDPLYRQQTLILQEGDRRLVRKIPVGEAAREHLRDYGRNRKLLEESLRPDGRIRILPCQENADGSVDFPFCANPTLEEKLRGLSAADYVNRLLAFQEALEEAFGTVDFSADSDFTDFFGAHPALEKAEGLRSLRITDVDLRFDNVFCALPEEEAEEEKKDAYTLIDYEWVLHFPVPLPFVFYRALILDGAFHAFTEAERRQIREAMGITEALEGAFARMDAAFLAAVSPAETRLDYYATHATAITRVNHRLDWMLRRTVQQSRSRLSPGRYEDTACYRALTKPAQWTRAAGRAMRRAAKKRNAVGLLCSAALHLKRVGVKATLRKAARHVPAKLAEKGYIRLLAMTEEEKEEQRLQIFPRGITFSILVPLYNTPLPFLREMIDSVLDQTYRDWELCLADGSDEAHGEVGEYCLRLAETDARIKYRRLEHNGGISENTNACMEMATGEYFVLFDHDDLLHPSALYENMKAICDEDADFVYSDEAVFASPYRDRWISTHFKPDFAPENLLSNNYICHLSVFRASLLEQAGRFRPDFDGSQDHDLILRLTGAARKVAHIPKVLYYWRSHAGSVASDIGVKTYAISAGRRAVEDFCASRGERVTVESTPVYPTLYRVRFPLATTPSLRLVLRFGAGQDPVGTLRTLIPRLNYSNLAITAIVSGQAPDFSAPACTLDWRGCGANRCEDLAAAAAEAGEDVLLFMDPDLVPAGGTWVREMLSLATRENIGAVGARAVFTDDTIRHAGLVLGLGSRRLVGRTQFGVPVETGGYFGQLTVLENVSAVSAECLMVRRDRFEKVGGFDSAYQDTLFDADLCLALRETGCRNLVTPFAELKGGNRKHFSLDYGREASSYEADALLFRQTWAARLAEGDPYYNPNLTLDGGDYSCKKRRKGGST